MQLAGGTPLTPSPIDLYPWPVEQSTTGNLFCFARSFLSQLRSTFSIVQRKGKCNLQFAELVKGHCCTDLWRNFIGGESQDEGNLFPVPFSEVCKFGYVPVFQSQIVSLQNRSRIRNTGKYCMFCVSQNQKKR